MSIINFNKSNEQLHVGDKIEFIAENFGGILIPGTVEQILPRGLFGIKFTYRMFQDCKCLITQEDIIRKLD